MRSIPRRTKANKGGATNTAPNRNDAQTRQETNTMHTAAAIAPAYQTLPLSLLRESDTNPRRTFDESKLHELAEVEVEDESERIERERQREEQQADRQRIAQKREATFRRIMDNVPASLPADHLRLTLRALVDSDEYSIFDDAATHYTGNDENNQQSAAEVLSNAIAAVKDEELPAVLVRIAFSGHVAAVREGETDYLTDAAKLFIPAKTKAKAEKRIPAAIAAKMMTKKRKA